MNDNKLLRERYSEQINIIHEVLDSILPTREEIENPQFEKKSFHFPKIDFPVRLSNNVLCSARCNIDDDVEVEEDEEDASRKVYAGARNSVR